MADCKRPDIEERWAKGRKGGGRGATITQVYARRSRGWDERRAKDPHMSVALQGFIRDLTISSDRVQCRPAWPGHVHQDIWSWVRLNLDAASSSAVGWSYNPLNHAQRWLAITCCVVRLLC